MSAETPTPSPPEPTQEVIATLAARFIPPIHLPPGWEEDPAEIVNASHNEMHGVPVDLGERIIQPQAGRPTPFEAVAEAAVARARVLLAAAAGYKRKERLEMEAAETADAEKSEAWSKKAAKHIAVFERIAPKVDEIPVIEALKLAWPDVVRAGKKNGTMERNLFHYYRAFHVGVIERNRYRLGLPHLRVLFSDKATDADRQKAVPWAAPVTSPACIILEPPEGDRISHYEFPDLISWLQEFRGSRAWKEAYSTLQKENGKKGAKESAKAAKSQKERDLEVWEYTGPAGGKRVRNGLE